MTAPDAGADSGVGDADYKIIVLSASAGQSK
jgi:hypothetical protein